MVSAQVGGDRVEGGRAGGGPGVGEPGVGVAGGRSGEEGGAWVGDKMAVKMPPSQSDAYLHREDRIQPPHLHSGEPL